jgi:hypothetical protein
MLDELADFVVFHRLELSGGNLCRRCRAAHQAGRRVATTADVLSPERRIRRR